jgi:hypothetical protein
LTSELFSNGGCGWRPNPQLAQVLADDSIKIKIDQKRKVKRISKTKSAGLDLKAVRRPSESLIK